MSKRVPCKFFANGGCLKGEQCQYFHEQKDEMHHTQICTYHQKGFCSYGSRCKYKHVKSYSQVQAWAPSSSRNEWRAPASDSFAAKNAHGKSKWVAKSRESVSSSKPAVKLGCQFVNTSDFEYVSNVLPADRPLCLSSVDGKCILGERCSNLHGQQCATCGKYCLHPFRPEENEEHKKACEEKKKHLEILKESEEIECNVCLERVLSKPTAALRKFGILPECDHPFCISCIRNWRNISPTSGIDVNSAVRACPVCRKLSYFVIPSAIWYSTKEEKQNIIDSYKAKLKLIDCKHFNFGDGNCPFGTRCFYKHKVKPGTYTWTHQHPPPRRHPIRGSNGFDMHYMLDMLGDVDLEPEEMYAVMRETETFNEMSPLEMMLMSTMLSHGPEAFDNLDELSEEEFDDLDPFSVAYLSAMMLASDVDDSLGDDEPF